MPKESGTEYDKPADKVVAALREMQGEFAQLSELDEMEHNYALKLVDQLKQIQSALNTAVPIPKEALPSAYSSAKEAYLAVDAVVVIIDEEGKHSSTPLSKFEPSQILSTVTLATPFIKQAIAEKRKATGERVEVLERILREVKKASNSLKETSRYADQAEEDLVASSITTE